MSGSQLSWVIIAGFVLIGASSYLPRSVKGWIGRAGAFGLGATALAALALWALPHVIGPQASPLERIVFVALAALIAQCPLIVMRKAFAPDQVYARSSARRESA